MIDDESELSDAASMDNYDGDRSKSTSMATSSQEFSNTGRLTSRVTPSRLARRTQGFYQESDANGSDDDTVQTAEGRGKVGTRLASPAGPSLRSAKRIMSSYQESDADDSDDGPIKMNRTKRKSASPFFIPALSSRKRKQPTPVFRGGKRRKLEFQPWDEDSDLEGDIEKLVLQHDPNMQVVKMEDLDCSPFEKLLPNDLDLVNLSAASNRFSETIHPQNSSVWSSRFLNKFDHPLIDNTNQFCAAYKERSLVLESFINFKDGTDPRLEPQLTILLDMVLEAFNPRNPWEKPPATSKNLALLQNADSRWMREFLSTALFNNCHPSNQKPFGDPHRVFDALQLTFSYLLLSPAYKMAKVTTFYRDDYDISRVYNWNASFGTLYARLPDEPAAKPSKLFPNLPVPKATRKYRLDTHTLLHIRNFWHRHMITDMMAQPLRGDIEENTYSHAVQKLADLDHIPKAWAKSLLPAPAATYRALSGTKSHIDTSRQPEPTLIAREMPPKRKWCGFYSTMRPWPNSSNLKLALTGFVDEQTDAANWSHIDPLTLDLRFSSSNTEVVYLDRGSTDQRAAEFLQPGIGNQQKTIKGIKRKGEATTLWPQTFADIPIFKHTVPSPAEAQELETQGYGKTWFVKGIAPFMDINAEIRKANGADVGDDRGRKAGKCPPGGSLRPVMSSLANANISSSSLPSGDNDQASREGGDADNRKAGSIQDKDILSLKHRYLSMRVRGVVHPLPWQHPDGAATTGDGSVMDDPFVSTTKRSKPLSRMVPPMPVPGFHRVVLVFYMPSLAQAVQQLEHCFEEYGNSFGVSISAQMDNDAVAGIMAGLANGNVAAANAAANAATINAATGGAPESAADNDSQINDKVVKLLTKHLHGLVTRKEAEIVAADEANRRKREASVASAANGRSGSDAAVSGSSLTALTSSEVWTPGLLEYLELNLHPDGQISWEDIDYAYAYEGAICPGGNVMLGRWWRIGADGLSEEVHSIGGEVDFAGAGVPDGMDRARGKGFDYWQQGGQGEGTADTGSAHAATFGVASAGPSNAATESSFATPPATPGAVLGDYIEDAEDVGFAAAAVAADSAVHNKDLDRGPFVFWTMRDDED
ncbi:uncharacterized protein AB675_428 [Cyphellophora attinorum]|uniref:Uncharacterized protein n=1 Tax=Cyphellophora attinorum TaxID=1664694 RepID=A0A0N1HYE6_9EURO|nr:uncharacterized protein AB675_428 [Phialophora attinorum]KPI45843.1 hypothetical protein AB675_428 [Phialophora attinorum]